MQTAQDVPAFLVNEVTSGMVKLEVIDDFGKKLKSPIRFRELGDRAHTWMFPSAKRANACQLVPLCLYKEKLLIVKGINAVHYA
jgi:hypothetical protein